MSLHKAFSLVLTTLALVGVGACAATPTAPTAKPTVPVARTKIALLLPELKTARYESQDLPLFREKLQALGFDVNANLIYLNASQDAALQQQQAENALAQGAKVLLLDPVDSVAAARIADLAQQQGVPVIAYDRLIKNSQGVSYYLSFDNEQVGKLQANSLLEALKDIPNPRVVMINGSPTDNNASMFKAGAKGVFEGKVQLVAEYDTPDWSPDQAQAEMLRILTRLNLGVDGVYAANDGTAGGAIAAMKTANMRPWPPVVGQDAELAAIQRILIGEQYMTVYKAIKPEAEAAAVLAYALFMDQEPPAGLVNSTVDNGAYAVPSILLTPVAVTKANIKDTVIADGFWAVDLVCAADFVKACQEAGLLGSP